VGEGYLATQVDSRTFGTQIQRLADDLNRPDLINICTQYLQDAMRYFQRRPFFFNETDNSVVPNWAASTITPQGTCVQGGIISSGTIGVFCALNAGITGVVQPTWPSTVFTVPADTPPVFPPPPSGTAGTVQDNTVLWANIGTYQPQGSGIFTALSTVYNVNQYQPPIDYVSPSMVEVVWSGNIRKEMQKISYQELRGYDVIRPSPPYSYPTMWAYFQQQIYLWPYPNAFYAITLSYRAAPTLVQGTNDSNFWTTIAERLIRKYAQASICREVLGDQSAAQIAMSAATEELSALRSQGIMTQNAGSAGITASDW
jgi:hypothetical protein